MSTIVRITCPACGTEAIDPEANCWKCGSLLKPRETQEPIAAPEQQMQRVPFFWRRTKAPEKPQAPLEAPITFDGILAADLIPETPSDQSALDPAPTRTMTTLTGEIVDIPGDSPLSLSLSEPAAKIGESEIAAEPASPIFVLSFCKACGYQNPEGVMECVKCKTMLEVVAEAPPEIQPIPRAWGFDVLGVAWFVLGFGAIFSGIFLLKAIPNQTGPSWADYFWTGVVACAPGILIFIRHVFCKVLFWVMTLASIGVWAVIGFLWYFIGIQISNNSEVALIWLAMLSALSAISYATVRLNDAFDFTL